MLSQGAAASGLLIESGDLVLLTFNLGNGRDAEEIARSMALTPEEAASIHLLETGHAVVRLKGRLAMPVLVRFPLVPISKGVAKRQLRSPPEGGKQLPNS